MHTYKREFYHGIIYEKSKKGYIPVRYIERHINKNDGYPKF